MDDELFPAGTVCRLKSGGPAMTSAGHEKDQWEKPVVAVHWIDQRGTPRRADYPAAMLVTVEDDSAEPAP